MSITPRLATAGILAAAALSSAVVLAADAPQAGDAPRWGFELKIGDFEPDLDDYERYYGDETTTLVAVTGSWQYRRWLEIGAELGYMSDEGTGRLSGSGTPSGEVTYTLVPATVFVGLRGIWSDEQLLVPYFSAGLTMAYYDQDIEFQSGASGTSDVGGNFRAGLGLLLDRLDPRTGSDRNPSLLKNSYLFVEYQDFSTEDGDLDLGGKIWLVGIRLEI